VLLGFVLLLFVAARLIARPRRTRTPRTRPGPESTVRGPGRLPFRRSAGARPTEDPR
jgi:hypothetical protein